jgi:hypothetical protein
MNLSEELSDNEIQILDIILNLEPVDESFLATIKIHEDIILPIETLNEILDKLLKHQFTVITKEQYRTNITIKTESRNIVREILESYWRRNNINEMTFKANAEKNLLGILKLLEFRYDDKPHIGFSDYYRDADAIGICDAMARARFMFKHTWSSKKHYYESYYLRRFPFNMEKILEQLIIEKINLKGLDIDFDWTTLLIALYSDRPLAPVDFKLNFSHLTLDEINEFLFKLEQRGILTRQDGEVTIPKVLRDIVKNYFFFNQYSQFRSLLLQRLRRRISERTSNLFILGLIKRILMSSPLIKTSEPFCSVKRGLLVNVNDNELKEASKLGVLYITSNEIIIAYEIVTELETLLKSALMTDFFRTVPPNDNLRAMQTWIEIFGQCREYVKIWDEYVDEETLDIIDRFCPQDVTITILSSIEKPRDIDVDESEERVKSMRNSGRKIKLFFVGDVRSGKAPFHKRYIISKNVCYSLTSSLKGIGKSKSVDIIGVPESVKISEIEPAYEYWTDAPLKELEQKGYTRIDFDKWIARLKG